LVDHRQLRASAIVEEISDHIDDVGVLPHLKGTLCLTDLLSGRGVIRDGEVMDITARPRRCAGSDMKTPHDARVVRVVGLELWARRRCWVGGGKESFVRRTHRFHAL
jgi:hypothetical protein